MIRFGTKSLLIGFAIIAVWLFTFSGYAAARDVRASVLMVVFLAVGFAAVYNRGKARAFWAGFFAVMLLCGGNLWQGPANKYVPDFNWRAQQPTVYQQLQIYSAPQAYVPPTTATGPWTNSPPPVAVAPTVIPVPAVGNLEFDLALNASIETAWMFALATLVGLTGAYIYSQIHKPPAQDCA